MRPSMKSWYAGIPPPVSGCFQSRSMAYSLPWTRLLIRRSVGAVLAGAPGADTVVRSRALLSGEEVSAASRARTVKV